MRTLRGAIGDSELLDKKEIPIIYMPVKLSLSPNPRESSCSALRPPSTAPPPVLPLWRADKRPSLAWHVIALAALPAPVSPAGLCATVPIAFNYAVALVCGSGGEVSRCRCSMASPGPLEAGEMKTTKTL